MMQVGFLPAAPLPGSVKVAQRPVKPCGVGASPTLAANFPGGNDYRQRPRTVEVMAGTVSSAPGF